MKVKTGDIVWLDETPEGFANPSSGVAIVGAASNGGWWLLFYERGPVCHFRDASMTVLREATGDEVIEALRLINGEYDDHRYELDDKIDLWAKWKAAWINYAGDFYGWEPGDPIANRVARNKAREGDA